MNLDVNTSLSQLNSAIIAALSGLLVGAAIRLGNKFFDKKKEQLEEHVTLRKELREELDAVKEEINLLRQQVDEWREKYYHQVELTNQLKMDVIRLTDELDEYKRISGVFPNEKHNGWFETSPDE